MNTNGSSNAATPMRHVNIFGVDVDAVDMAGAVELARQAVLSGRPHQHVVLNAAKIVAMHDDEELARIIRGCNFILADGAPIVWFAHLAGQRLPERVAGADLFEKLVATAAADGHSVYFLGAQQHVVDRVVKVFRDRHPTLKVAGWHDGFWTSDDEVIELIRQAQPHYLFLAIPSPRKEYWLNANLDRLQVPFSMGVGGSFDVVAGEITRAPRWMQRIGMEWSWRLIKEPRRMFKRYLVGNTRFIILAGKELVSARRGRAVG